MARRYQSWWTMVVHCVRGRALKQRNLEERAALTAMASACTKPGLRGKCSLNSLVSTLWAMGRASARPPRYLV